VESENDSETEGPKRWECLKTTAESQEEGGRRSDDEQRPWAADLLMKRSGEVSRCGNGGVGQLCVSEPALQRTKGASLTSQVKLYAKGTRPGKTGPLTMGAASVALFPSAPCHSVKVETDARCQAS